MKLSVIYSYIILFRKKTNANRFLKMRMRLCETCIVIYIFFYLVAVKYYILFGFLPTNRVKRFKRTSANPGRIRPYYDCYYYYTPCTSPYIL